MVLTARMIKEKNILTPFREKYKVEGVSGGCSIASYDVALDQELVLGPMDFKLVSTEERFTMPLDVCGMVHDKSTWARVGIAVQNTFIDPGWCGYLTLEISNNTVESFIIPKGTPIAQIVFHMMAEPVEVGYSGKYQDQKQGPQVPLYESSFEEK